MNNNALSSLLIFLHPTHARRAYAYGTALARDPPVKKSKSFPARVLPRDSVRILACGNSGGWGLSFFVKAEGREHA